jgi:hypothetical protein
VTRFIAATSLALTATLALAADVLGSIITAAPAPLALATAPATIFHGDFIATAIAANMVGPVGCVVISAAGLADMARRIIAATALADVISPITGLVVRTVARGGRRAERGKARHYGQRQDGMLGLDHGYSPGSARRLVGACTARTRRGCAYSRMREFFA